MSEQDKGTPAVNDRQKLVSLWTARVFAVLSLIFTAYLIYNVAVDQQGRFDASDMVLMPMTIAMFLVSIFSLRLIQRNRHALGTGLLFFTVVLIPATVLTVLLNGVLPIAITYVVVMATVMIAQVLPKTSRRLAIAAAAIAILLNIGIELWNPGFRSNTNSGGYISGIILLGVLGLLAYFIRLAWRGSIRVKLLAPILSILIVMALAYTFYNYSSITQSNAAEETQTLTLLRNNVLNQVDGLQELALAIATNIANNPEVQSLFASGNRERLVEISQPNFNALQTQFDVKQYQFILPPATSFLRLHQLDKFGDDLSSIRATVMQANREEKPVSGPEIGRGGFGVRGVVPIAYQGKHVGVIDIGLDIGPAFLESIKKQYGVDAQIMLDSQAAKAATFVVPTTEIAGANQNLLFQAGTNSNPIYADASVYPRVMTGELVISQISLNNRNYSISSIPLKDFSGKVIGILEIVADRTQALATQNNNLWLSILISLAAIALGGFLIVLFINFIVSPIGELTKTAIAVAEGNLERNAVVRSKDEIGTLATTFNLMLIQLRESFATLEQRVAERTQSLELAAEVGRSVSQVRALDIMLKDAAELIRSRFDLYYVQVYLTDPSQTNLVLQSGTGAVGATLVGRSHRLPLNRASINGRAALEKRSVVVDDTSASATFRPNPLLPNTRSEMAVPLIIGETVVGVLDLQSQNAGQLNQGVLTAFEALAGQLAIAIQNSNFLAQVEQARADIEAQARRQARTNWDEYMDAIHNPEETGFVFERNKIAPLTTQIHLPADENIVTAPISVTGEALGNLVVEMTGQSPIGQTSELVNAIARQVAQHIESLRLLENAERFRFEAEQSSRRLTREGWKDFAEAHAGEGLSYLYDLNEVRSVDQTTEQPVDEAAFNLPIKVRDEIVGKLSVIGLQADDKEALDLVYAITERLGSHIESLRQFDETQRGQIELNKRAQQLSAVAEVSTVSSRELNIEKMLESVVHLTQRKFGLYHAHIFTFNENDASLQIIACGWKEGDVHEGTHGTATIPLGQEQSLVARAGRTRRAVIANNVHTEPGWLPNPLLPDTESELAVPLVIGDQMLGVLDVQSDRLNAFTEEDANIMTTLAAQIATALQNARSFARAQRQAERESTLNIISQKIQNATTVEAVLQIAARELGHALGAPMTIAQLSMKEKK